MRRTFSYWTMEKWCGTGGKSAGNIMDIITEEVVLRRVLGAVSVEGLDHTNPTSARQRSWTVVVRACQDPFSPSRLERRAGGGVFFFSREGSPGLTPLTTLTIAHGLSEEPSQAGGDFNALSCPFKADSGYRGWVHLQSMDVPRFPYEVRNSRRVFRTTQRRHLMYPSSLAPSRFSVGMERVVGSRATDCRFGTSGMLTATL